MTATLWKIKAEDEESKNTSYVAAHTAVEAINIFVNRYNYDDEAVRSVRRVTNQVANVAALVEA